MRPTAIFANNDYAAVIAMSEAQQMGLAIPDDISVVGYDNSYLARLGLRLDECAGAQTQRPDHRHVGDGLALAAMEDARWPDGSGAVGSWWSVTRVRRFPRDGSVDVQDSRLGGASEPTGSGLRSAAAARRRTHRAIGWPQQLYGMFQSDRPHLRGFYQSGGFEVLDPGEPLTLYAATGNTDDAMVPEPNES